MARYIGSKCKQCRREGKNYSLKVKDVSQLLVQLKKTLCSRATRSS